MTTNPLFDDSPWTLTLDMCMCGDCRYRRHRETMDMLSAMLIDSGVTITYHRWPDIPEPPTPNLPARRKWLARRSRNFRIDGTAIYVPGWELTAPSGRQRWYPTREAMLRDAMRFRQREAIDTALEALNKIGMQLIS